MVQIISGTQIAKEIKEEIKEEVAELGNKGIVPCLAVVRVGNDAASAVYVRNKQKACDYVGIKSLTYELGEETTEEELLSVVNELNENADVNGILVQLPLPAHINADIVISSISPDKDVDGFNPINVGKLWMGEKGFVSCTPAGIVQMLKRSNISIEGRNCVVIGRSNIVGKPMAALMMRENATVTVAHSKTRNLKDVTKNADILIVAIGKKRFITSEYVKDGAVVIDVGIHRDEQGKLCGDVDYEDVLSKVSAITPVPGGVGPMTITMLLKNCVEAAKIG